jgi:hypothetical protein
LLDKSEEAISLLTEKNQASLSQINSLQENIKVLEKKSAKY